MLHRMLVLSVFTLTLLTALPAVATAVTTQIYFNDFETSATAPGGTWSSTKISTVPNGTGSVLGFHDKYLGQFAKGATVSLTLNSVPSGNLTVDFYLLIIGSWDGNSTTSGPDRWRLSLNGGPTLLDTAFSNQSPSQSYPAAYNPSNLKNNPPQTGAVQGYMQGVSGTDTLGFGINNSVYHLSFTFPNSSSTVVLNFSSGSSSSGKTFGLDNVRVTDPSCDDDCHPAVPEPSTLLLLGSGLTGLGLLGFWRRSRRRGAQA